ncbi:MAG: DUF1351 domain-containing protein [Cyanobacteria bacterium K_Offshore_surface_m2_239]|nr:DUF1351 domain-containing protein [Cyanobacteria bacterium K_Offshore_surface_m2_239]
MTETRTVLANVTTAEVRALSAFESLSEQIALAAQEAEGLTFDYSEKEGNKAARSHVAGLRKLSGAIERARKEAKAVHLERGRNVDEAAKALAKQVAALIEPHDNAIKAIEEAEQRRVKRLRQRLSDLASLLDSVTTSDQAKEKMEAARAVDPSTFEEFEEEAKDLKVRVDYALSQAYDSLTALEQQQEELQRLRAEAAERERRDREEALRVDGERRAAEQLARQQQAERDRVEARERQARDRAEEAERRERLAAQQLAEAQQREQRWRQEEDERRRQEAQRENERQMRAETMRAAFVKYFAGEIGQHQISPEQLGELIANGVFMGGSVFVNWENFDLRYQPGARLLRAAIKRGELDQSHTTAQ